MPARCSITVLNGSRAGATQTFDLRETPKITLGNDPTCDVSLPAEQYSGVARRHAALVWDAETGKLTLLDSSLEGCFIEGRRILRQKLPHDSTVTLARQGVSLKIVWKQEEPIRNTVPDLAAPPQPAAVAHTVLPTARNGYSRGLILGGIALICGGLWWLWQRSESNTSETAYLQAAKEKSLLETSRDYEQRMAGELAAVQQQISTAKRELQSGLVDVDARATEADKKAGNVKGDAEMFVEMARKYEGAIALVQGGCSATAFAIAPRVFATNAHVSRPTHEALSEGRSCTLVLNKGKGRRLHIIRAVVHPEWDDKYHHPGSAYDVGLLFTDEDAPFFLPVVPEQELRKVDAGYPVAYIGFPQEGLRGGGVDSDDPIATMKTGIITSISRWDLSSGSFENQLLLRENLGSSGGASGSPIINRNGEVIGILNAGNVVGTLGGARIDNTALIDFAQRIDCLKDLWPDYPKP